MGLGPDWLDTHTAAAALVSWGAPSSTVRIEAGYVYGSEQTMVRV